MVPVGTNAKRHRSRTNGSPADREEAVRSVRHGLPRSGELFERFPYGLMVVDREGRVLAVNERARELFAIDAAAREGGSPRCCELICGAVAGQVNNGDGACLTSRTLEAASPLPEVRVDIERKGSVSAAWITSAPIDAEGSATLFHLRPGVPQDCRCRTDADWSPHAEAPDLRITTLGTTRVERQQRSIGGLWLQHRAGQLLKYLVCERRRVVASDQIAEALWPNAGPEALNRVRHYVHVLRERLEPERPKRAPSQLILARRGGYMLDDRVWIDADEFEDEVGAGLALFVQGEGDAAVKRLERGLSLYTGDFFAEEPYAEWALGERDRLRELAARGLRALVRLKLSAAELDAAAGQARRLAELEPFDMDVQREFIEMCLRRGRRSEAVRRYAVVRKRALREFGEEPDFELADLAS